MAPEGRWKTVKAIFFLKMRRSLRARRPRDAAGRAMLQSAGSCARFTDRIEDSAVSRHLLN